MKAVSMEKAKALLIVTLLLVSFLAAEAGREMKSNEDVYSPNWLGWWWWGLHPWWWWGLHPWGLKDAPPHGYGGKGDMPKDHNKGNGYGYGYGYGYGSGNGNGNGEGGKGDTPDIGGAGHNGDGGIDP